MYNELIILPDAQNDINTAYYFYEGREQGLGEKFLEVLDFEFDRMKENPDLFQIAFGRYRRVVIHKFPFIIYYVFEDAKLIIYSVFHTSQDIEKLTDRLKAQ